MAAAFVLGEVYAAGYIKTGIFLGLLSAAILFFIKRMRQLHSDRMRLAAELLAALLCLLCGFCRFSQEEYRRSWAEAVAQRQAETLVTMQARVDWIKETQYGAALMLSQVRIRGEESETLKLYAYVEEAGEILPGDTIQAEGILEDFERPGNPGEFDSSAYYRSLGFHYAAALKRLTVVRTGVLPYRYLLMLRDSFSEALETVCTSKAQEIYQAMLLGEKSGLSEEIKELYSAGGISHILAISGLHIAVIGMGIYRILRRFGGFRSSGVLAGAVTSLYVLMTGSAVSSCRAVIMFVLQLFSFICGRSYDMLSAAAAALLLLLWRNPMYIFNSGCQLSFGAVFAVGMLYPLLLRLTEAEAFLYKAFLSSAAVSFITFPVLAWHFYEISPYSVLINLIVIPCMTLVMLSGLLGGMAGLCNPWAGRFLIALGQSILKLYEWLCRGMELLPGSRIITGRPKLWIVLSYYGLLAAGLALASRLRASKTSEEEKGRKERILAVAGFLAFLAGILCIKPQGAFFVCFLDVSQGDGIYMETPEHVRILVDGGSSDRQKLYEDSLLPFLKYRGVPELDFAIVTHADEDHISGLKALLAEGRIAVKKLLLPEIAKQMQDEAYLELISLAEQSGAEVGFLSAGDRLQSGLLEIRCLHPYQGLYTEERNAYSTVLEVHYGEFGMLLTGDLDSAGERFLIQYMITEEKQYDVLKVAHHGSRYSTQEEFLERIKAGYAVISCGKKNRYGHPHEELLQRLVSAGIKILVTAEQGALMWESDGKEVRIIDIR